MLENIIKLIHLILVIFIIIAPFVNNRQIKINIFIILVYLLFQYLTGYNKCGLTELEYYMMGKDYQQGFLYRLIGPVIKVSEDYFDKWIFIFHFIYVGILGYQLYYSISI
jgi:hypothetical protein